MFFAELLGRKLFNVVTPYKRIFLSFEYSENDTLRIYTLPALRMASYFFTPGDIIYIDNIDQLSNLTYIDYDLINSQDEKLAKHREDFNVFKELVKQTLATKNYFAIKVEHKIIFSEVMHVVCKIVDEERNIIGDSSSQTSSQVLKVI